MSVFLSINQKQTLESLLNIYENIKFNLFVKVSLKPNKISMTE